MAEAQTPDMLARAIETAIKHETQRIAAEESEKAQLAVAKRVGEAVDRIALSVLSHYEIQIHGNVVTIRVSKKGER